MSTNTARSGCGEFRVELKQEPKQLEIAAPVFIGGRLNRIPVGSNTSLPGDVSKELSAVGAIVCPDVEAMLERITEMATERSSWRRFASPPFPSALFHPKHQDSASQIGVVVFGLLRHLGLDAHHPEPGMSDLHFCGSVVGGLRVIGVSGLVL